MPRAEPRADGDEMLEGPPPGRIELDGNLQLIERALTNLIDNAVRHTPGPDPVRVRLERDEARANVRTAGPGFPGELAQRLDAGHPCATPRCGDRAAASAGWGSL